MRKEVKLSFLDDDVIICTEYPKEPTKKLLEAKNNTSKYTASKSIYKNELHLYL